MSAEAALLFANDAFYAAFGAGDVAAMDAVWAFGAPVTCIHPGGSVIEGRAAVLESWRPILQSGQTQGFACQGATAHVVGDVGWVTCLEVLGDGALAATNIFALEDGMWKRASSPDSPRRRPFPGWHDGPRSTSSESSLGRMPEPCLTLFRPGNG